MTTIYRFCGGPGEGPADAVDLAHELNGRESPFKRRGRSTRTMATYGL
jgi:hypothetical protein